MTTNSRPAKDIHEIDFHFDIMCPYAIRTAIWIRSVSEQNGLRVNWRFFSLEEVNRVEGKRHPWERSWSYGWSLLRIAAQLQRDSNDAVGRWYFAAGEALHQHGNRIHEPEVARVVLSDLGFDPEIVDASMQDPTLDDVIRADHQRVLDAGGYGVPTMFIGERCLFGPVLINPPSGEAALRLWDSVATWVEFDDVFELQQPKTPSIEKRIVTSFEPYLAARDWVSINRGDRIEFTDDGFVVADQTTSETSAQ